MKRFLVLIAFILFIVVASAQNMSYKILTNDIQVVDLKGDTISVFKQLALNKTVIIDISAVWCPPCWELHKSKLLDSLNMRPDFYSMLIEADPNSGDSSLYGKGSHSRGNWTHANYPIINLKDRSIIKDLDFSYYPTLYMILPDKRYYNISSSEYDLDNVRLIAILKRHLLTCYKNPHQ